MNFKVTRTDGNPFTKNEITKLQTGLEKVTAFTGYLQKESDEPTSVTVSVFSARTSKTHIQSAILNTFGKDKDNYQAYQV